MESMKYAQRLGLGFTLAFILSCGSSTPKTFNGPWQFTLTSSASPGVIFTGNTTLGPSGTGITGTVAFANNPCATSGLLAGGSSGPNVFFQITEGDQVISLTGTVNSAYTAMSGTYTATAGGCTNGDTGSWTATAG
jgi:hypothetical protein